MFRTLLLLAFLASQVTAGITIIPPQPTEHQLVRVKFDQGDKVFVLGTGFTPVDVERCEQTLVFTGPKGNYAVLGFDANDAPFQMVVTISGSGPGPAPGPAPGPSPNPNLNGLALVIYNQAIQQVPELARKEEAPILADIYRGTSSAINAGGIKNIGEVQKHLTNQFQATNRKFDKAWKQIIETLNNTLRENVSSMPQLATAYKDVANGLEAAK